MLGNNEALIRGGDVVCNVVFMSIRGLNVLMKPLVHQHVYY